MAVLLCKKEGEVFLQLKPLTEGKTKSNRKDPPQQKRPSRPPPPACPTAKWTWDWPTEEGYFWVYGLLYPDDKKFSLNVGKSYKSLDGKMTYAVNGHFFYQSEAGLVMWSPIVPPTMVPTPEIFYRKQYPEAFESGK